MHQQQCFTSLPKFNFNFDHPAKFVNGLPGFLNYFGQTHTQTGRKEKSNTINLFVTVAGVTSRWQHLAKIGAFSGLQPRTLAALLVAEHHSVNFGAICGQNVIDSTS